MSTSAPNATRVVRSEARGRHWVAWIPGENGKPLNSVVLVSETREEAERRAQDWSKKVGR